MTSKKQQHSMPRSEGEKIKTSKPHYSRKNNIFYDGAYKMVCKVGRCQQHKEKSYDLIMPTRGHIDSTSDVVQDQLIRRGGKHYRDGRALE